MKHWKEFQVLSESPQGSVKIESNQPVQIEIPYLLHDMIWFEVSSFWSPSNKMSWLYLQLHSLHLCLLSSGSSSSSFVFFFQAYGSENFLMSHWLPYHGYGNQGFSANWKWKKSSFFSFSSIYKSLLCPSFFIFFFSLSLIIFPLILRLLWGLGE